ncbi:PR-1 protein [Mycena floridula]|nr:PR-1 protein [Mycena floridula]
MHFLAVICASLTIVGFSHVDGLILLRQAPADLQKQSLDAHNAARASYGVKAALTWNDALYNDTKTWAQNCVFQHSTPGGKYGENLAASSGTYGVPQAVTAWMSESYSNPGFSLQTGHFTQVVWNATTQIACATAFCPSPKIFNGYNATYVVCRYTPPGNVNGRFPQNVFRHT